VNGILGGAVTADYILTRSKRRTIALYVRDDATIEVRAPLKTPKQDIDKFVRSKADWIAGKVALKREQAAARAEFALAYGASVAYRGREYPIEAKPGSRCGFDDTRFYVPPGLSPEQLQSAVAQVYRMLAKRDLSAKALDFAKRMGVMPSAVKINGAATRWGSCSAKKSLNFSWRLMMAEDAVIDYVVVHELAHITEMNHSDRFWAVVERVLPDCRERRMKLKALQRKLRLEDWT
jgi:predicted metal-dependent hydrolase